jgi:hypothetical protein
MLTKPGGSTRERQDDFNWSIGEAEEACEVVQAFLQIKVLLKISIPNEKDQNTNLDRR